MRVKVGEKYIYNGSDFPSCLVEVQQVSISGMRVKVLPFGCSQWKWVDVGDLQVPRDEAQHAASDTHRWLIVSASECQGNGIEHRQKRQWFESKEEAREEAGKIITKNKGKGIRLAILEAHEIVEERVEVELKITEFKA